jgi:myosin heavy subunit
MDGLLTNVRTVNDALAVRVKACQMSKQELEKTLIAKQILDVQKHELHEKTLKDMNETIRLLRVENTSQGRRLYEVASENLKLKREHKELWEDLFANTSQLVQTRKSESETLQRESEMIRRRNESNLDNDIIKSQLSTLIDNKDTLARMQSNKSALESDVQDLKNKLNDLQNDAERNLEQNKKIATTMNERSESYSQQLGEQLRLLATCKATNLKLTTELNDKKELEEKLYNLMHLLDSSHLNNMYTNVPQPDIMYSQVLNTRPQPMYEPYPPKSDRVFETPMQPQSAQTKQPQNNNKASDRILSSELDFSMNDTLDRLPNGLSIDQPSKQSGFIAFVSYDKNSDDMWFNKVKNIRPPDGIQEQLSLYQNVRVASTNPSDDVVVSNFIAPLFRKVSKTLPDVKNKIDSTAKGFVLIHEKGDTNVVESATKKLIGDLMGTPFYTTVYTDWWGLFGAQKNTNGVKNRLQEKIRSVLSNKDETAGDLRIIYFYE